MLVANRDDDYCSEMTLFRNGLLDHSQPFGRSTYTTTMFRTVRKSLIFGSPYCSYYLDLQMEENSFFYYVYSHPLQTGRGTIGSCPTLTHAFRRKYLSQRSVDEIEARRPEERSLGQSFFLACEQSRTPTPSRGGCRAAICFIYQGRMRSILGTHTPLYSITTVALCSFANRNKN